MRKLNKIIVHCTATHPHHNIGVREIREWHTAPPPRGNGWSDVGYHLVIRRDGSVEFGRPFDTPGAHVKGHNKDSIGIALVGGLDEYEIAQDNFSGAQKRSLRIVIDLLSNIFGIKDIGGHRDYLGRGDIPKECPCFDVRRWYSGEEV